MKAFLCNLAGSAGIHKATDDISGVWELISHAFYRQQGFTVLGTSQGCHSTSDKGLITQGGSTIGATFAWASVSVDSRRPGSITLWAE